MDVSGEDHKHPTRLTVDQLHHLVEGAGLLRRIVEAEHGRDLSKATLRKLRRGLACPDVHDQVAAKVATETRIYRNHTMRKLRAIRRAMDWKERAP
jgi:predicted DNA-binding transcriptional regulator YafY